MYYLWLNDLQAGPFTLQQIQSMWNGGQITSKTLFWQKGDPDWQPLGKIVSLIEGTPPVDQATPIPALEKKVVQPGDFPANPAPGAGQPRPEEIQWAGHPTLWKWAGLLFVGLLLCLLPIGIYLFYPSYAVAAAPLPFGLFIFFYILLSRNSTRYSVSNKRVSVETGILTKTSRELRIGDIRSIAAKVNILGYGNIEFASAASDDAEVIFHAVPRAAYVRDLVKKLQS